MCASCRRRRPKRELLRVVRTPAGWRVDPTGKAPGRGAYVCPDEPACREEKKLRRWAGAGARALAEALAAHLGGEDGEGSNLPTGQRAGHGEQGAHGAPGHDGGGV
ncbi:YlxR family protein [Oceanithermus profundus]|uniref:YlxR family protein n=1 Tax=Oceanithermus profundus TaxID=187137 RepID=UPI000A053E13|nr:YlxR family protein [Oceanithermus profundus]